MAGLDPNRVGYNNVDRQWYVDDEPTCIGWGYYYSPCDPSRVVCAGADATAGYGATQVALIAELVSEGIERHRMCPASSQCSGPFFIGDCLSPYWVEILESAGLDPNHVGYNETDREWYVDGKPTCVGWGYWYSPCDTANLVCAGAEGTFGYGIAQAALIAEVIDRGNLQHHLCTEAALPVPAPAPVTEPIPIPSPEAERPAPVPAPITDASPVPAPATDANPVPSPDTNTLAPAPTPVTESSPVPSPDIHVPAPMPAELPAPMLAEVPAPVPADVPAPLLAEVPAPVPAAVPAGCAPADGVCDVHEAGVGVNASLNSAACHWDMGDCCEEPCVDGAYPCGYLGYACIDPAVTGDGPCVASCASDLSPLCAAQQQGCVNTCIQDDVECDEPDVPGNYSSCVDALSWCADYCDYQAVACWADNAARCRLNCGSSFPETDPNSFSGPTPASVPVPNPTGSQSPTPDLPTPATVDVPSPSPIDCGCEQFALLQAQIDELRELL